MRIVNFVFAHFPISKNITFMIHIFSIPANPTNIFTFLYKQVQKNDFIFCPEITIFFLIFERPLSIHTIYRKLKKKWDAFLERRSHKSAM